MLQKHGNFVKDIWVTGTYNSVNVIGRTFMVDGQPYVSIIDEFAIANDIAFHLLEDVKALKIVGVKPVLSISRKTTNMHEIAEKTMFNIGSFNLN